MTLDIALLILRLAVGGVAIAHGTQKLGWLGGGLTPAGVAKGFHAMGFRPGAFWTSVVIVAEVVGGALTVLGLGGPLGPGIIAADLLVATVVVHLPRGFWSTAGGIEFTLSIAAVALALVLVGNGGWSADAALGVTYPEWLLPAWLAVMAAGVVLAFLSRALSASGAKPAPSDGKEQAA